MNKTYIEKCKEVFEKKNVVKVSDKTKMHYRKITDKQISQEYMFIISNYSNVFLKENYEICSQTHSPMADEYGAEPFLYFLGLEGKESFFNVFATYQEQLPKNYYPIALADGGNLLCISGENDGIYLWIHDEEDNMCYKIFNSLKDMIFSITKVERKIDDLGIIDGGLPDDFFDMI